MTTITPFLMFEGNAVEAMKFYTSLFDDGAIVEADYYNGDDGGPEGTVKRALFTVGGQRCYCIDSPQPHDFTFTPSQSLFVECDSEKQLTTLCKKLSKNGKFLMPLDNYGFSKKFAWLNDRFGVSWQLNFS